jgi:hypothetical protein
VMPEFGMANLILYQCPWTGFTVQVRLAEDADAETNEMVTCPACRNFHFINRKTGKLASDKA